MSDSAKNISEVGKKLIKNVARLNEFVQELKQEGYTFLDYDNALLKNGWLIPDELMVRDIMLLAFQFENNQIDNADKFLINYFKKQLIRIKRELIKKYPDREGILKEAFEAHKKKMYYSSTILFISQADGITENNILSGKNFKNFVKRNEAHPLSELFTNPNPITSTFYKKKLDNGDETKINRHGIMHGLILDYGSELNSYKALSLLYFVSNHRNEIA